MMAAISVMFSTAALIINTILYIMMKDIDK